MERIWDAIGWLPVRTVALRIVPFARGFASAVVLVEGFRFPSDLMTAWLGKKQIPSTSPVSLRVTAPLG